MCGSHHHRSHREHCGRTRRASSFLEAWLLLLLKDDAAHGYELLDRLRQNLTGGLCPDPGTVYRNLRRMEEEGLVASTWELRDAGPPRRLYRLTEQGEELLQAWAAHVEECRAGLDRFLEVYHQMNRSADEE